MMRKLLSAGLLLSLSVSAGAELIPIPVCDSNTWIVNNAPKWKMQRLKGMTLTCNEHDKVTALLSAHYVPGTNGVTGRLWANFAINKQTTSRLQILAEDTFTPIKADAWQWKQNGSAVCKPATGKVASCLVKLVKP